MKIKKSILALVLTTAVGISVVGCGKEEKKASTDDKKTEVTASKDDTKKEEAKKEEETKKEEEKKDEAKPAETQAPAQTTGTTAAPAAATTAAPAATTTAAPAATTTAPSTPAQKLDALVKGLNGNLVTVSDTALEFMGMKGAKVIQVGAAKYMVLAVDESKLTAANKVQLDSAKKSHQVSMGNVFAPAYYNKGIYVVNTSQKGVSKMDPKVVAIMDTFQ